jgi:hypothetical protein
MLERGASLNADSASSRYRAASSFILDYLGAQGFEAWWVRRPLSKKFGPARGRPKTTDAATGVRRKREREAATCVPRAGAIGQGHPERIGTL